MRRIALWFGAAFLLSSAGSSQPAAIGLVRIPVAPPSITIIIDGEPEPAWQEPAVEPRNEIYLRDFEGRPPPADVEHAITLLRHALPADYLAQLMREFGYVPGSHPAPKSRRTDLREVDLAKFLFDRWVFANPDTNLAQEFSCLSWGEFDIGIFLTLLTHAEGRSGETESEQWQLNRSAQRHRISQESVQNARTAWVRCRQLVERGWRSKAYTSAPDSR